MRNSVTGISLLVKVQIFFFSIAINQPHEQNNGVGSAVRLLSQDRDAGLWRLEIAGPEVVWLLNNMKNFIILVLK